MQKNNSERLLTAMSNSILIHLNNTAIDHLNCGEVYKAQRILTQAFYGSIRQSHRQHILEPSIEKMGFEYMLQDCFRPLQRCFPGSNSFASSDPHLFLSLNFVRIETSHLSLECVDRFCTCALSWALGYNLAVIYSLVGFQRGVKAGGISFLKRASRILMPIRRQILLQQTSSTFWLSFKFSILNNSICIFREISKTDLPQIVLAMEELLDKSRTSLRPEDVKKFYLSIQFMNNDNVIAAAA